MRAQYFPTYCAALLLVTALCTVTIGAQTDVRCANLTETTCVAGTGCQWMPNTKACVSATAPGTAPTPSTSSCATTLAMECLTKPNCFLEQTGFSSAACVDFTSCAQLRFQAQCDAAAQQQKPCAWSAATGNCSQSSDVAVNCTAYTSTQTCEAQQACFVQMQPSSATNTPTAFKACVSKITCVPITAQQACLTAGCNWTMSATCLPPSTSAATPPPTSSCSAATASVNACWNVSGCFPVSKTGTPLQCLSTTSCRGLQGDACVMVGCLSNTAGECVPPTRPTTTTITTTTAAPSTTRMPTTVAPQTTPMPTSKCTLITNTDACWNTTGCYPLTKLNAFMACSDSSVCHEQSSTTCTANQCILSSSGQCVAPTRPTTTTTSTTTTTTASPKTDASQTSTTRAPTTTTTTTTTTAAPSTTRMPTTVAPQTTPMPTSKCTLITNADACWNTTGCFPYFRSSSDATTIQQREMSVCLDASVCTALRGQPLACIAQQCVTVDSTSLQCVPPTKPAVTCERLSLADCTRNASCLVVSRTACAARCPANMTLCPSGACAKSLTMCTQCSSSRVQCWDSTCATSDADCSCPPTQPEYCSATKGCVVSKEACAAATNRTCSGDTATRCSDGTCAVSTAACPCPPTRPLRCPSSTEDAATGIMTSSQMVSMCVAALAECSVTCSGETPEKCSNGACAASPKGCPCSTAAPYRCPTDAKCYATMAECPCGEEGLVRCLGADNVCSKNCSVMCPASDVRCPDGSCAKNQYRCPCVPSMMLPVVSINVALSNFDVGRQVRLPALVNYSVCGVDRSNDVAVSWVFVRQSTGAAFALPAASITRGPTATIPANTFPVDQSIAATVTAVANASAGLVGTASIVLTFAAAPPSLDIIGGAQTSVLEASSFSIAVEVVDTYKERGAKVQWTCCNLSATPVPATAASACPSQCSFFGTPSTYDNQRKFVVEQMPVGTFRFAAWYANASDTQTVRVIPRPSTSNNGTNNNNNTAGNNGTTPDIVLPTIPQVFIQPLRQLPIAGQPLYLYAVFTSWSDGLTASWLVNGTSPSATAFAGAKWDRTTLMLPGHALAIGATYNITLVVGVKALPSLVVTASMWVSTIHVPPMRCVVSSADQNATALSSSIRIRAYLEGATGAAATADDTMSSIANWEPEYRFGYVDLTDFEAGRWENISLSQAYQDTPVLERTAPAVAALRGKGDAGSVDVVFFVALRLKRADDVAFARCQRTIHRFVQNASSIISDARETLQTAKDTKNLGTVLSTAQMISTVVAVQGATAPANASGSDNNAATNGTTAREALKDVARALSAAVAENAKDLSSEQRGQVVRSLQSLVASVTSTNEDVPNATRADVMDALRQAIKLPNTSDASSSDTAFQPQRDGPAVLQTLDALRGDANSSRVAQTLAQSLALSTATGESSSLTSAKFNLVGMSRAPSDVNGRSVATTTTTMELPSTFTEHTGTNDAARVSVTAAEFTENPFGGGGLKQDEIIASNVVDFGVLADGAAVAVHSLANPIQLTIRVNTSRRANPRPSDNLNVSCKYRNEVTNQWSDTGVTTISFDNTTGILICNTTHLSSFGAALYVLSAAPTPNGGTPTTIGDDGTSSTTIIAVCVVVGIVVVVLVGATIYLRSRSSGAAGTGQRIQDLDDKSEGLLPRQVEMMPHVQGTQPMMMKQAQDVSEPQHHYIEVDL